MKQKNYVAYLRQSTVKQEISGLGVEAQREIIQNYLKDRKTIAEYIETESGRKSNRPKLTEALELCRKTNSVLIVAKLDRLSRNVAFTSKLLESDVEIVFCDFPEANKLVLHIISSIAEYEAGLISQRTKQSLKAKKARGYKLGKSENLLNKLEQAVKNSNKTNHQKALDNPNNKRAIALLKNLVKEDRSLSEMARILNSEGFVTAMGKEFRASQVSILLKRYNLKRIEIMKYNYLIFLDYSTGEIIRIKLTEEQKRDSEKYDDFEEYLMTLEDGYGFRLLDCSWMAVERLQETVYGF